MTTKTFSRSKKLTSAGSTEKRYASRQEEMEKVFLKIHPTNELPQFLPDGWKQKDTESLSLVAGHEYFIEITPIGQSVTSHFKSMKYEDRDCYLSNEKSELSVLKNYSQQNCRYECKVNFATEKCGCIPWDFPLKPKNLTGYECDVFGRTCFFNAIKQFIATEETICLHCKDDCEYMHYHKTQIKEKEINYNNFNPYSNCNPDYFCEYLLDANNTIEPLTWYEEYKDFIDLANGKEKKDIFSAETKKQKAQGLLRDHIVVHIDFASSKVETNVLDARWTFMDRIANLGGTLGLCANITGGTILTMIHLLVLIIKVCFNCCFKHQN